MAELPERTLIGTTPCLPIELNNPARVIMRILVPVGWQTADILVEEELGGVWGSLKNQDGTAVVIKAVAGDLVRLDECVFALSRSVRFKSSASQGAARVLKIQVAKLSELDTGG